MTRAGEKMLTTILVAACGVLFVLAIALQVGLGRGYHWLDADAVNADNAGGGAIDREAYRLPPETDFAATNQKPLFNDDRRPQKEDATGGDEAPPPSPLNISLTGTLMAAKPAMRMAMVRENGKVNTIALKEGMPLPGEQGAWTLSQVKNRSAVFKSNSGEEVEVELAMVQAGPKPGPQAHNQPPGTPPPHAQNAPAAGAPVTAQSEELQRRIEERRKQMREAAERMKAERQEQQGQQPQQQPQQQ